MKWVAKFHQEKKTLKKLIQSTQPVSKKKDRVQYAKLRCNIRYANNLPNTLSLSVSFEHFNARRIRLSSYRIKISVWRHNAYMRLELSPFLSGPSEK